MPAFDASGPLKHAVRAGPVGAREFPAAEGQIRHLPELRRPVPIGSMFIVFDGVDGAGKSTQLRLAAQWLADRGREVVCCADPGSTLLGQKLREILLGAHSTQVSMRAETLMFMAARAQLVDEVISPSLAAGKWVLCDRFTFSTVVYQGHAGGLSPGEVWSVNRVATHGVWPGLTLLFDLPVDVAMQRLGHRALDRMESRGAEYMERVRAGFREEADKWPRGVEWIDASGTQAEVFEKVAGFLALALRSPAS